MLKINYKNIITKLIAAMLAVVLVFLSNRLFIPKYISENTDGRITSEFYDVKTDIDVIFLGASTVHYGISPDYMWGEYGFTSYDRSNASQTMWQSYYMLQDTLTYKKPSLVVLDVGFMKYGADFVEEPGNRKTIEGMRDIRAKIGAINTSAHESEQKLSYFLPILRYHSRWKDLKPEDVKYMLKSPAVTYDGYIMDFSKVDGTNEYDGTEAEYEAFPEKATEYLYRIIDTCREEKIPLLLIKMPTYINGWGYVHDAEMARIASEKGASFISFMEKQDELGLDGNEHYIDAEHTNVTGAEIFSKYLGAYLKENYELPDHSQDAALKAVWDEKLARYERDKK